MAKGISKISGNKLPLVEEDNIYSVDSFYPGTGNVNDNDIKWKLFVQEQAGNWRELVGEVKTGRSVPFSIGKKWYGHKILVEAYLHNPEIKSPPGLIVMPVPGERKIDKIGFLDRNGNKLQEPPKYAQTIKVRIETINMFGETLKVSLWERDTWTSEGHDPDENTNIWGSEREYKVNNENGIVEFDLLMDPSWALRADKGMWDVEGSEHEYYLLVKGFGAQTKYSIERSVSDEVDTSPVGRTQPRPTSPRPQPRPQQRTNESEKQARIPVKGIGADPQAENSGRTVAIVEENKVEGLIDAYFAKKEFTKKTGEEAGSHEYTVKSNGNKTGTDAEKENIANAILNKPEIKALAEKKQYTTLEAIKEVLTKEVYNKDDKITFKTFKLGEEFKRINSAPLEEKVYLVTTSYLLDGKQPKIIIKEKDGIIKGSPDATLPVLELTEAQMEQTEPLEENERTEKSEFTGTFKDNIVKVPIQLRPKSDDELTEWKEKIAKGKQDGEYTYTFSNENGTVINDENKKNLAGIIVGNAKEGKLGNPKIEDGKTAFAEDVEGKLENKTYAKGDTITFPLYKKLTEMLWLEVSCDGELESYNKEFLKKDGAYFEIGRKCVCEEIIRAFLRTLRVGEGTGELIKSRDKETNEVIYIPHDFDKGYTTAFGGNTITDLSDHPRINYGGSTAAGAYQVMKNTWDDSQYTDKKAQYNINSFSKENQDKFSVLLMKHHPGCSDLLELLLSGQTENAIRSRASRIWASLPEKGDNSRYLFKGKPQPVTPMKTVLEHYEEFLNEELEGNSPLYLKKGFLKEFSIPCNCGNESAGNSDWHHPLDRMELRGWYGSGFYPDSSDHGPASIRHSGTHDGLDLYAPIGTPVYACVTGKVHEVYVSETYGNTINIEGTYNGQTYYFFYAHLSEVNVESQDPVNAGDPIGKTGKTGNASSQEAKMNHLHFEVRTTGNRTGGRIDPLTTIEELGRDVITNPEEANQK